MKRFSLDHSQQIKSIVFAIFAAVFPIALATINAPNFDIRTVFTWDLVNDLIKTGSVAALYTIYSFFQKNKPNTAIVDDSTLVGKDSNTIIRDGASGVTPPIQ